ncbi:DUF4367 domain-containing protein [Candidatus Parcubacteria bacterium]|nr:DUF4367 domain-containing protein [Candidatus Parcubacteria bacterium]
MSEPKNYIEINGRKYDSRTGQMIGSHIPPGTTDSRPVASRSINMDGVIRKPQAKTNNSVFSPRIKPAKPANVARSVKPAKTKSVQKSTTLMRPAVKKPEHKPAVKTQEHNPPVIKHAPEGRLKRAGQVKKSPHIRRFNASQHRPEVVKRQAPMHVVHQKPAAPREENVIQKSINESIDQFDQVIHDATSHLETYVEKHKPKKPRKLVFTAASLSVILLCGLLIYQAVPAVNVKLAGNKAGFSAGLPAYSPAGYGLSDNVQASSGEVTLAYSSRTDSKGYKVHQQPSNWNSQSLVNNFLLAENKPYQTYENNGKTIYIYEETNATWVDGGIWYRIEGDASLTSDQLLRIANGL